MALALAEAGASVAVTSRTLSNAQDSAKRISETTGAETLALKIGNPKAVNLIVLGFALTGSARYGQDQGDLFCDLADIKAVLQHRLAAKEKMLDASIKALEAGYFANRP